MKKMLFMLLCCPFILFSQSKKKLKQDVLLYQDSVYDLESEVESLKFTNYSLKQEINSLEDSIVNLDYENNINVTDIRNLKSEKINLQSSINDLQKEITKINLMYNEETSINLELLDSIKSINIALNKAESLIDSLEDVKIENTISFSDISSNSEFSMRNIIGTWGLKTLVVNSNDEYIDFDDIYGYSRRNDEYKYDSEKSIIEEITFIDPNIAVIKLEDMTKLSCLFEVNKDTKSKYRKIINIQFVDTDREELEFTISKYGEAYIFNYNFSSLKNFFDRDDYDNNTNHFRVKGVSYDNEWNVYDDYNIDIIGVIK